MKHYKTRKSFSTIQIAYLDHIPGNLCSFSPSRNKFDPATLIHMEVTFANVQ